MATHLDRSDESREPGMEGGHCRDASDTDRYPEGEIYSSREDMVELGGLHATPFDTCFGLEVSASSASRSKDVKESAMRPRRVTCLSSLHAFVAQ
jgi:hypothetical protein